MTDLVYCVSCGIVRAVLMPPADCRACKQLESLPVVLKPNAPVSGLQFGSGSASV